MPSWLISVLSAAGTVLLSLTVTLVFNKVIGIPKEYKKQKEAELEAERLKEEEQQRKEEEHRLADEARDKKIEELTTAVAALEEAVAVLPTYRNQSLKIQEQLQNTDRAILDACMEIKNSLNERLDRLEKRDKNSIRAKLLDEYRLFTDETKNPMLAWSEMEHHAFFELVGDYEDLGGNDFVHSEVLPNVNRLAVIPMSNRAELLKLMNSRKL